jgi:molybdenum cofactor biosynthesis enzyme MoaA
MPLDAQGIWDRSGVLTAAEILQILADGIGPLDEVPDRDPRAPATEYAFSDGVGRIGFIASISKPFCGNCNRIRLTADGHIRYCLFAVDETEVKTLLRSQASDALPQFEALFPKNGPGTKLIPRNLWLRLDQCMPSAADLRYSEIQSVR